jgi:L-lactate dehydrogenase
MKVGIVGAGYVGATAAFAMAMRGSCSDIVIVDVDDKKAWAQASDIQHAVPFSNAMTVRSGAYKDLSGAKVIIITSGVNQKPGETRLQLLERNAAIFNEIVPKILSAEPDAMLIVATNPVDILTSITECIAGLPPGRVIGSGTTLDTARLRALIGHEIQIDPQHVHAYVIGEHGDSEVVAWSSAIVAGLKLPFYCKSRKINWNTTIQNTITENVRHAAYQIIQGKGATYYGIGAVLARITEIIIKNHKAVLTVSTTCDPYDVALSLPRLVSGNGVVDLIGIEMNATETEAFEKSATILSDALKQIKL